jgi:hypothetical protein
MTTGANADRTAFTTCNSTAKIKEIFQEDSLFDKTGTNNRIEASPTSRNEGLAKPEI